MLPFLRQAFPQVAFVDFTHTTDPGWRGIGYPRLSCQFSQFLDRQVVTSRFLAETYQDMAEIAPEKLSICYTNIDPEQWQPNPQRRKQTRAKLKVSEDTVVLLYPARIVEQKRPLFLVDLVKALSAKVPAIAVFVLGEGNLLPAMQAKIKQLELAAYFHLLPAVPPTDMLDFYAASDILLLPSAYEGISLAIFEAMAMALPVVASQVGGQPELVTPETGYLIPLGSADDAEIQAYLDKLLTLVQNPSLRQQMGTQARQRVSESFNLNEMADRMAATLSAAIAERQRQPTAEVVNWAIAEEMLLMTLEYLYQEQFLNYVWWKPD